MNISEIAACMIAATSFFHPMKEPPPPERETPAARDEADNGHKNSKILTKDLQAQSSRNAQAAQAIFFNKFNKFNTERGDQ